LSSPSPWAIPNLKETFSASWPFNKSTFSFSMFVNSIEVLIGALLKSGDFSAEIFVRLNPMICMLSVIGVCF